MLDEEQKRDESDEESNRARISVIRVTFYFPPADIVSQTLNFGLPAPLDIQVVGQDRKRDGNGDDQCASPRTGSYARPNSICFP